MEIVGEAVKFMFHKIRDHISYEFQHKRRVENFEKKVEKLKEKRDSVRRADAVDSDEIRADVTDWLVNVDNIINVEAKEVRDLEDKAKHKYCLIGLCPNFKSRYQLSKKAEKVGRAIDELLLLQQDDFDNVVLCRAAAGLTEPPTEEEWKESKMIYLMDNKLSTLPQKPSCPQLLTLCLQRNYQLREVPDLFFEDMPSLRLLNLSKTGIKSLPKSISCLGCLETLILRDYERLVNLPSEVGSLKLLKVLNLGGTELIELPKEVGKLGSLSYLEVSFYGSSTSTEHVKLPPKLISSLKALETLSISVYPGDCWWNKSVESFIEEVSSLRKLTCLSFYFPEVKFLELFLRRSAAWKKGSLTEFKFVVGRDIKLNASRIPLSMQLNDGLTSGQCLRFVNSEKIPDAVVKVLARCSVFYLDHHLDIKRLSEFGIANIKKLKYCIISECPDLQTIVVGKDVTEAVFPSLEHLSIHCSWSLVSIWEGVVPPGSFAALRTLSLHACPVLTYVFRSSMLQFLSNLEELKVEDCKNIKKIVYSEKVAESGFVTLKSLTLHHLPQLVHIWEGAQTQLLFEQISVYDCPQLKQISTSSELKQTLKEIRGEKDWWDGLVWEDKESCSNFAAIFTPILEEDAHSSPSSVAVKM